MIEKQAVEQVVSDYLQSVDSVLYLVDVAVHPGNRIVVELDSDEGVAIDDCVVLTKHIESQFDREVEDYELEVGSAGLTSPFKVLRQYEGAIDEEVEVLCRGGVKEKGTLLRASAEAIVLSIPKRVKVEGSKRKQDIVLELEIAMKDVLQTKRIIKI